MPSKADDFHKGLVKIISDNYTKPKSNGEWAVADAQQQQRLDRLKNSIDAWKREKWPDSNGNADTFQDPYKKEILDHTAELLNAFKDYVSHSPIFPEQEQTGNRQFQSIMEIMEVPDHPQIIDQESNMNGLFYRDMVHNQNYWEATGSHIQVMRDLCDHMTNITDLSVSNDFDTGQREKTALALDTIFTSKRDSYGKCKGGHSERISEANDVIAGTPEEMILARWNDYGNGLMMENLSQNNQRPFGLPEAYESHVQPFLNYVAGTSKDLVGIKDDYFQDISANMEYNYHSLLADKVFAFPAFLAHYHQNDIDTKLKKFDKPNENPFLTPEEAANGHNYNLITQLWDSNIAPYVDSSLRESAHTSFLQDLVDVDGQVYNASIVENKVKEQSAFLICEAMKVAPMSLDEISTLNVSPEKRLKSMQEDSCVLSGLLVNFVSQGENEGIRTMQNAIDKNLVGVDMLGTALYSAAKYHEENLLQTINGFCPTDSKNEILASALLIAAQFQEDTVFSTLHRLVPQDVKENLTGFVMYHLINKELESFNIVNNSYPDPGKEREEMLGFAVFYCARENNKNAMDNLLLTLPEAKTEKVFTNALVESVHQRETEIAGNIMFLCPIEIEDDVYSEALSSLAIAADGKGVEMVGNTIPEEDRDESILAGFRTCAEHGGDAAALNIIKNVATEAKKADMFGDALYLDAIENDLATFNILKNACPPDELEASIALALYGCAMEKNVDAVNMVRNAWPSEDQENIYYLALEHAWLSKDNSQKIILMCDAIPDSLRTGVIQAAMVKNTIEERPDVLAQLDRALVTEDRATVIGRAMGAFALEGMTEELNTVNRLVQSEEQVNVFSETLASCVRTGEEEVPGALEMVNERIAGEQQMEVYTEALITVASEENINGLGLLEEAYPEQEDLRELRLTALLKGALEEKATAVSNLMKNLPDAERSEVATTVLKVVTEAQDHVAFNTVKEACPEQNKGEILEVVIRDSLEENQQGVDFLMEAFSKEERRTVLPSVLVSFYEGDNDRSYNMIMNACPQREKAVIEANVNQLLNQREASQAAVGQGAREQQQEGLQQRDQGQEPTRPQGFRAAMMTPMNDETGVERGRQQQRDSSRERSVSRSTSKGRRK